jgi:putative ABC transport system substrate-binding protein
MMKRREFTTLLGGAAVAWPSGAAGQKSAMKRVGVLMESSEPPADPRGDPLLAVFIERLQQLGWNEGRNLKIHFRWTGGNPAKLRILVKELSDLEPDVAVAQGNAAVTALREANNHLPIVFTQVSDPIGRGFVASLSRPGGSITGFSNFEASMGGKWLEKLREIAPTLRRVALMFNASTSPHIAAGFYLRAAEEAGRQVGMQTIIMPVDGDTDVEQKVRHFAGEPNSGLIVLPDAFTLAHADLLVSLTAKFGLPAIYPFRSFSVRGGLIFYGINTKEQYPGAALYVDRILKGAMPADLPVQAPSKFELVINLKVAKSLALSVPLQLQQIADEVIE